MPAEAEAEAEADDLEALAPVIVRRVEWGFNDWHMTAVEEVVADHLLDRSENLGGTDVRVRLGRIITGLRPVLNRP